MEQALRGRTALVTGANSGVGLELTKALLARGAEVAALVKSDFAPDEEEVSQARAQGRLRVYRADFADFVSLRKGLDAVKAGEKALDLVFNNAGVAFHDLKRIGNHEAHFVVNTVVPFIVLEELGPLIEAGTLKTVVQTSSNALQFVRSFSLEGLENPTKHVPLFGPYGASKLALSLWTREAAAAWKPKGITVVSVCPGGTRTKMTAEPQLWFMKLLFPLISHPASEGARRLLQAALSGSLAGSFRSGPGGRVVEPGFVDQAPRVLALVREIYQREYLTASSA